MPNLDSAAVEASVAAVRDEVRSLAARYRRRGAGPERVQVQRLARPTPCWQITARIEGSSQRVHGLSFTRQEVEFGNTRIVLPQPEVLMIIGASFKDDKLTLCLVEVDSAASDASRDADGTADPLRTVITTLEQISEPARQIAARRALRALSRAVANSPIQALADAASAPTDIEVLLRTLQQPDTIETLKAGDPFGPARLRGLQERQKLLTVEGGTLSAEQVAGHLDITRQAVNKRRHQGTLVGLDAGRHGYLYPAWQFVRAGTLAGLEAVLDALKSHDAWMQHIFMVSSNARLNDRTPLDELRHGRLDEVLRAARAFGEHGAA